MAELVAMSMEMNFGVVATFNFSPFVSAFYDIFARPFRTLTWMCLCVCVCVAFILHLFFWLCDVCQFLRRLAIFKRHPHPPCRAVSARCIFLQLIRSWLAIALVSPELNAESPKT